MSEGIGGAFAAVFGDEGWPKRLLDAGVLELHEWTHARDLEGQVIIERGPVEGDDGFKLGPTMLRCEAQSDLDAALERFGAWRPA